VESATRGTLKGISLIAPSYAYNWLGELAKGLAKKLAGLKTKLDH